MSERRFTDQDVAQILQRAAELDSTPVGVSVARGLSLSELEAIAGEVGIDPRMVVRAAAELGSPRPRAGRILLGKSLANRGTRVVQGELEREALGEIISVIDDSVPAQGTIGEALGAVRWSASDMIVSRQVALKPSRQETLIRVEERYGAAVRGALHGVPAGYGVIFGLALGLEGIGGVAPGISLAAVLGATGWALGRVLWNVVWGRSRRRVDALADKLAAEAEVRVDVPTPTTEAASGDVSGQP